jgi:hypothetical protein
MEAGYLSGNVNASISDPSGGQICIMGEEG